MKRELKFRAWVGEQMIEWDNLKSLRYAIENENTVVMQYTGLNDKNGKEIYECDIVKWTRKEWVDLMDEENGYKDVTSISYVEYKGHSFWVSDESFGHEGELLWNWEEMEVIGNIYENPELLTILAGGV